MVRYDCNPRSRGQGQAQYALYKRSISPFLATCVAIMSFPLQSTSATLHNARPMQTTQPSANTVAQWPIVDPIAAEPLVQRPSDIVASSISVTADNGAASVFAPGVALGDLDDNSEISVIDLIRLRNIINHIGPPATAQEAVRGDINLDGTVTISDLYLVRDVLTRREAPAYAIGDSGGSIESNGITLSVQPGVMDEPRSLSVHVLDPAKSLLSYGIDISSEAEDSVYVMAAFNIRQYSSRALNEPLPAILNATLSSVPPCSLRAANALFSAHEDMDGDGVGELSYEGELGVGPDSTSLYSRTPVPPQISEIVRNPYGLQKSKGVGLLVGEPITIKGANFDRPVVHFLDATSGREAIVRAWALSPDSCRVLVPFHPGNPEYGGTIRIAVENLRNHQISDAIGDYNIGWHYLSSGESDSLLAEYCEQNRQRCLRWAADVLELNDLTASDKEEMSSQAVFAAASMLALEDSLQGLPEDARRGLAGAIELSGVVGQIGLDKSTCTECYWELCYTLIRAVILNVANVYLGGVFTSLLHPMEVVEAAIIVHCIVTQCDPPCPDGTHLLSTNVDYYCPNIFSHRAKVCVYDELPQAQQYTQPAISIRDADKAAGTVYEHPLCGNIVKASERLPFGAVARVDASGAFALPGIPPSSVIQLSMYDPQTGLYDEQVAEVRSGDDIDRHVVYRPLVTFRPDTTTAIVALDLNRLVGGEIGEEAVRRVYKVYIDSSMHGDSVYCVGGSREALTYWIVTPSGHYAFRDSSLQGSWESCVALQETGTYEIMVARGVDGGSGAYEVGVFLGQGHLPRYVGNGLVGAMEARQEVYELICRAWVAPSDTVRIAAGAELAMHAELINNGALIVEDGSIVIGQGGQYTQGALGVVQGLAGRMNSIVVGEGGAIGHSAHSDSGFSIAVDTLVVAVGGGIQATGLGYRGGGQPGWPDQDWGETYPGVTGSYRGAGGSHGGSGGKSGSSGSAPGPVYDSLIDPHALGAGGAGIASYGLGMNGGGLVSIVADRLVLDGQIRADGVSFTGPYSGGGSGGAVNIRCREASGSGTITANGGSNAQGAAGAGGRIAVRWQEGGIEGWSLMASGGGGYPSNRASNAGAGTIYLLGPEDGPDGRLLVDNGGRDATMTPLTAEKTLFGSVEIRNGGKLGVGELTQELATTDSVLVTGANARLQMENGTLFSADRLIGRSSSRIILGEQMTINVPEMLVSSGDTLSSATSLNLASASDFILANGGIFENRRGAIFTIPRFTPANVTGGRFRNWGQLDVASDTVIVGLGVSLEDNGRLGEADSISVLQVFGILTHAGWGDASFYDDMADTGLVFRAGELSLESSGRIDVVGKGYRGGGQPGWPNRDWGETYPGVTGSYRGAGGSHGGVGGTGGSSGSAPGPVYDSLIDPHALGAGGAGIASYGLGMNGGGLVSIVADRLVLDGQIRADGVSFTGPYSGGGSGGAVNVRCHEASGSGTITANGGSNAQGGAGAGGRIVIRWAEGDAEAWLVRANGGDGIGTAGDGAAGTVQKLPLQLQQASEQSLSEGR